VECIATKFIRQHIPEAVLVESFASELTYQLPDDVASVKKFDDLFTDLDKKLKEVGISGYGVSSSSLEEVRSYTSLIDSAVMKLCLCYLL
jgi:ATP-binding cassette subfamily A (ABC1) protein 3